MGGVLAATVYFSRKIFYISIGSSYGNLILKMTGDRCFGVWPEHGYFNIL
jgi:hypothetical protein